MKKFLAKPPLLSTYSSLLTKIKTRIRQAQTRAAFSANIEMVRMYWEIGKMIDARQKDEGWGSGVLPRLAKDLRNELPEVKGFSVTNLKLMVQFYKEYQSINLIGQQPVGQIPWAHNVILMQKIKDHDTRCWYMQQVLEQGWGRDTLSAMIKNAVHKRQGKLTSNFKTRLPAPQSELIKHLEKFLIELGQGFAFVGRQYHVEVRGTDFYIDLLFYHLKLRSYVVVELKKGPFKPEYAGKMNFYCSVVDDKIRMQADNPTIGLILCQDRDKILAEYALRDIHKPIGVSGYELTQKLPSKLQSSLPSIKQIEDELSVRPKKSKK
jgi:predicted nuclease of restriction endonuclease-like (RecB) superfamily